MNKPIYMWERAIEKRPAITFSEFRLKNHLVSCAFGFYCGGSRGKKYHIKWASDGKCYIRYTSYRFPTGDINFDLL